MWLDQRKEQRIVKWTDCSEDDQEGQEEATEEGEQRKVQEQERLRNEREEKARRASRE